MTRPSDSHDPGGAQTPAGTAPTVYFDGRYVSKHDALIPPTDAGVIYGLGSFETLRVYSGRAFLADRHEERLAQTLERVGIPVPELDLAGVFAELSARNELPDGRGRFLVTGGHETAAAEFEQPRVYAELSSLPPDPLLGRSGVRVIFASGSLSHISGMKSLSYLSNTLARREARRVGAEEALLRGTTGEILEGATSNVHLVIDGVLTTPPADGRVLTGVTRGVVIEEARAARIPIDERAIFDADVERATEAFITSSVREVVPVEALGERRFRGARARERSIAFGVPRPGPERALHLTRFVTPLARAGTSCYRAPHETPHPRERRASPSCRRARRAHDLPRPRTGLCGRPHGDDHLRVERSRRIGRELARRRLLLLRRTARPDHGERRALRQERLHGGSSQPPFGTRVRVRRADGGQTVVVRINDRGPFVEGREIDVSRRAAESLDFVVEGLVTVELRIVEEPEGTPLARGSRRTATDGLKRAGRPSPCVSTGEARRAA